MAKILLLSPPYLDLYGELSTAAGRYFPLGLGYIAAYLRHYGGHEVHMYEPEAQGLDLEDLARLMSALQPDVVGITCSTPNFSRAISLAALCKEKTRALVVMGGVHATALPEFIVRNYQEVIDCVVVGEGEITMLELVEAFASGRSLENVPGLVFMVGDQARRTPVRPYIEDLDRLPHPARDLIPQELFAPNAHNARYRKCVSMLTSRGCPFNCTFCAARLVSGRKYRMHSTEYVIGEMEMLKRDYGTRQLLITDDTFTVNRTRLLEVCEEMIRRNLGLQWFCFSQVSAVDRETLRIMKRAGCYNIGFGVESADPEILRHMGKNIKPQEALEAVRLANEVGMKTQAFYVFGTPGETRRQMERTVKFANEVDSILAFFNMLVPYPGTKDFEHFFSSIRLEDINWDDFVAIGERCVLKENSEVSAADIEKLIADANFAYYFTPRRLLRQLRHIGTFYELGNYMKGGLSFLRQIARWSS